MQLEDFIWYVVETRPREEQKAALDIGFKGYQPLLLHTTDWKGDGPELSRLVKRPWITGYIFVGIKPEQFIGGVPPLGKIAAARGVMRIVSPLRVPMRAMQVLLENAEFPSGLVWTRKTAHHFAGRPGHSVRLSDRSPYQGFVAAITNSDLRGRVTVELELFGRKVPTHIGLEDVEQLFDQNGNIIDKCELAPEPVNSGR
jgi:transcription antitermination factor NusG